MDDSGSLRTRITNLQRRVVAQLPDPLKNRLYDLKDLYLYKTGKVNWTPPIVKQRTVRQYARRFSIKTLIETGTYEGRMIESCLGTFDRIYSIELDTTLWAAACEKFAGHPHVQLVHGDSSRELSRILAHLEGPAVFWLDAHYSGGITARGEEDTPVSAELRWILSHHMAGHVVLIDDARNFTGEAGYPTTKEIRSIVKMHRPRWEVEIEKDIIRIHEVDRSSPS